LRELVDYIHLHPAKCGDWKTLALSNEATLSNTDAGTSGNAKV
jgi:hypothetical protein